MKTVPVSTKEIKQGFPVTIVRKAGYTEERKGECYSFKPGGTLIMMLCVLRDTNCTHLKGLSFVFFLVTASTNSERS